ncbi:hypothetical protein PWT90_05727 [Aphanocladium album]|nr:hypothetical protein PWT90_05727 [Aphanocladium album]
MPLATRTGRFRGGGGLDNVWLIGARPPFSSGPALRVAVSTGKQAIELWCLLEISPQDIHAFGLSRAYRLLRGGASIPAMSFDKLPDELLLEICRYVDDVKTLSRLSRCNRRTHGMLDWRTYQLSHDRKDSMDLKWAIRKNRISPFRKRITHRTPWPSDILLQSAVTGRQRMVDLLLKSSPEFREQTYKCQSPKKLPLIAASYANQVAVVEVLVRHANTSLSELASDEATAPESHLAIADLHNLAHATAFRWAVIRGHIDSAFELIESKVDVCTLANTHYYRSEFSSHIDWPCVVIAAKLGWIEILELLIEHGADVDARDPNDQTALFAAAEQDRLDCVKLLLQAGANPLLGNRHGRTPLEEAMPVGNAELAKLLLDAVALVDPEFEVRGTVLSIGVHCNWAKNRKLMMDHAVEVAVTRNSQPIKSQVLALSVIAKDAQAMHAVLDSGVDVRLTFHGKTPVEHAIEFNCHSLIQALLSSCPEALTASPDGVTPLQFAARQGNNEVCGLLLHRFGVDVNAPSLNDAKTTALHEAVRKDHRRTVEFLLQNRANIHQKEQGGYTPLHAAAIDCDVRMVTLLLARGADLHALTDDNLTPLQLVRQLRPHDNRPGLSEVLNPEGHERRDYQRLYYSYPLY